LVAGFVQVTTALWRPFEAEFGNFQNELQRQNDHIRREIDLASQQAARQERQLQEIEREAAFRYRLSGNLFHRRAKLDSDEARNWRLQASERQSSWFRFVICIVDVVLTMYQERKRNAYSILFLPTITRQHSNKLVESDIATPARGLPK